MKCWPTGNPLFIMVWFSGKSLVIIHEKKVGIAANFLLDFKTFLWMLLSLESGGPFAHGCRLPSYSVVLQRRNGGGLEQVI